MADMHEFGKMNVEDRGGEHEYSYADEGNVAPVPGPTPSQTVGPFFAYGLTPGSYGYPLAEIHSTSYMPEDAECMPITLEGQVFDGKGQAVHDAVVEIIHADHHGQYAASRRNDHFTGYFRAGTGANGPAEKGGNTNYVFQTVKPGPTQIGAAPFITFIISMRGLLNHCITRAYFEGDDLATDPVLNQVPQARRDTLIMKKTSKNKYRFDIHMQGENETVFFDI